MNYKNCPHCQGDLVSPICIPLEHEDYDTLKDFVEDISKKVEEVTGEPDVELKTLSTDPKKKWTYPEIIQLLIDEIIDLKSKHQPQSGSSSTDDCDLNWGPIENCTDCPQDECGKMQNLINLVGQIKEKTDTW